MDLRKEIYFYANLAAFPATGALNCLYVASATGIIYTWNGSSYVASGPGPVPTGLNYQGLWDANANLPLITSSVGTVGNYYIVGTAGTTNINGINDWGVGDWIVFSSTGVWQKIDNSDKEGYATIEDEGNPLTQRSTINFVGAGVSAADSGGKTVVTIPAGGLTNFTEAENTSAPNTTVYVDSLTAAGSTTNADVAIRPKGNGALLTAIPDNTATGGNKRGQYAVDLNFYRTGANQVASGNYAFLAGGGGIASGQSAVAFGATASGNSSTALQSSVASNTHAFAHGSRCTSSGSGSVAFGGYVYVDTIASGDNSTAINGANQATANFAFAAGGYNNVANGYMSYAFGTQGHTFGITGRMVKNYSFNNVAGECQKSIFNLGVRTTGNTATTLTVGGGAADTTNQVILSNQSAYRFKGTIIGKKSGTTDTAAWDIDGLIVRGANAAATTLNVSNVTLVQNTPAWGTPTLAADTTNGGLQVQVIGAAATNIQWTAVIETTEVIYA